MSKEFELKLDQAVWDRNQNGLVKDVLEQEFNLTKWQILGLRLFGKIFVNNESAGLFDHAAVGDSVKVVLSDDWSLEPEVKTEPEILYEEDDFVIVNKPSGIPTNANKGYQGVSVESILKEFYEKNNKKVNLRALDSLGSTTSGVEIFAKNESAFEKLSELLNEGKLRKSYLGIVHGLFDEKTGVINKPIKKVEGQIERVIAEDGEPAVTNYEVLEERTVNGEPYSVLSIKPETRRSHQIRTHLKSIGHSLLGDELYGGKKTLIDRPALHGLFTKFVSPFTNKEVFAKAKLPWEFEDVLSNGVDVKRFTDWLSDDDTVITKGLLSGGALAGAAALLKGKDLPKVDADKDIDAALREIEEVAEVDLDDVNLKAKKPIDEKVVAGATMAGAAATALQGQLGKVHDGAVDGALRVQDKLGDVHDKAVEGALNVQDKLGDVQEKVVEGALNVQDKLGDVQDKVVDGALHVQDKLGDVQDKVIDGALNVQDKLGDVHDNMVEGAHRVQDQIGTAVDRQKKSNWWKWLLPLLLLLGLLWWLLGLRGCGNTAGTAGTATTPKRTAEEVYNSMKFEFDPSAKVEYGKSWDLKSITRSSEGGDVSILTDIDPTKVGEQELVVRMTTKDDDGNDVTRDFTQKVQIADTQAPEIKFNAPELKLALGDAFDPQTNVTVSDPVDGVLKFSDNGGNGSYVVRSNVDTSKPGTYEVEVVATDANGNESTNKFNVVVGEGDGATAAGTDAANAGTAGGTDAANAGTTGSGTTGGTDANAGGSADGASLPNTLTSGN